MPTIITVPNQQLVTIHKDRPTYNFLQISNDHWQNALKDLEPYAFQLYLYFACNANEFTFALSPSAINSAIGMPRSTFYKKRELLKEKGYLIQKGERLHFYETPQSPEIPLLKFTPPSTDNGAFKF